MYETLTFSEALDVFTLNGVKLFSDGNEYSVRFVGRTEDGFSQIIITHDGDDYVFNDCKLKPYLGGVTEEDEDYSSGIFEYYSSDESETADLVFVYTNLTYIGQFIFNINEPEEGLFSGYNMSPVFYVDRKGAASVLTAKLWFECKAEGFKVAFIDFDYDSVQFSKVWYSYNNVSETYENVTIEGGEDGEFINNVVLLSDGSTVLSYSNLVTDGSISFDCTVTINGVEHTFSCVVADYEEKIGAIVKLSSYDSSLFIIGESPDSYGKDLIRATGVDEDNVKIKKLWVCSIGDGTDGDSFSCKFHYDVDLLPDETVVINGVEYGNYMAGTLTADDGYELHYRLPNDIDRINYEFFDEKIYSKKEFDSISLYDEDGGYLNDTLDINLPNVPSEGETSVKYVVYVRVNEDPDNNSFSVTTQSDFCSFIRERNKVTLILEKNLSNSERNGYFTFAANKSPDDSIILNVTQNPTNYSVDVSYYDEDSGEYVTSNPLEPLEPLTVYVEDDCSSHTYLFKVDSGGGTGGFRIYDVIKKVLHYKVGETDYSLETKYDNALIKTQNEDGFSITTNGYIGYFEDYSLIEQELELKYFNDRLSEATEFSSALNSDDEEYAFSDMKAEYILTVSHSDIVGVTDQVSMVFTHEDDAGDEPVIRTEETSAVNYIRPLPFIENEETEEEAEEIVEEPFTLTTESGSNVFTVSHEAQIAQLRLLITPVSELEKSYVVCSYTGTFIKKTSYYVYDGVGVVEMTIKSNVSSAERVCRCTIQALNHPEAKLFIRVVQEGIS